MNIIVNGQSREVEPGTTIAGLLEALGLAGRPLAVEVNLQIAPRGSHAQRALAEGDRLEIVTLVGGG